MAARILYQVIATFPDAGTAGEFVAWLEGGHVDEVIAAGAHSGMIVRLDGADPARPRVMAQYVFSTRQMFDRYITEHATRLRADGLKRFPPERGIAFERVVGEIV